MVDIRAVLLAIQTSHFRFCV